MTVTCNLSCLHLFSLLSAIQLTLVSLLLLEIVPSTLSASSLCEDDAANTCSISLKSSCNFFNLSRSLLCVSLPVCTIFHPRSHPRPSLSLCPSVFSSNSMFSKGPSAGVLFAPPECSFTRLFARLLLLVIVDKLLCFPASCRVWRSPEAVEVQVQWAGRRAAGSRRTLSKWPARCFCRRKLRTCKCERTVSEMDTGRQTGPNRCRVHRVHQPADSRVPQPSFAPSRVPPLQRPDSSSPLRTPCGFAILQSIIILQHKKAKH